MKTVSGLFDTYAHALEAVHALNAAGITNTDVSLIANSPEGVGKPFDIVGKDLTAGAELGAALGGAGGLLAGLGVIAIPGLGPVLAGGWLVAAAIGAVAGAGVGAATGGVIGLLTSAGVPEPDAQIYAEGLRRGGTLVSARVGDELAEMAFDVLRRANGIDIEDLRRVYEQEGWSGFDDNAAATTPEQEADARDRYPLVPPFL
ncbi:MAG: hypothetical protein ROZ09_11270 [Thiobacillus sp.]|uniref:hypothetical protein n=1 Tax=Thiobacillus sp. TaxID=924 RepID=UPI002894A909|nr:hypothetical protein [Thiobacillus sp.]MDT3707399.1 hypothetical protein [Thiobacillus sp.]